MSLQHLMRYRLPTQTLSLFSCGGGALEGSGMVQGRFREEIGGIIFLPDDQFVVIK